MYFQQVFKNVFQYHHLVLHKTKWFLNSKTDTNSPNVISFSEIVMHLFLKIVYKSLLSIIFQLFQFDSRYSYLKLIQTADTRSLLRADTSVLILIPLYRKTKK